MFIYTLYVFILPTINRKRIFIHYFKRTLMNSNETIENSSNSMANTWIRKKKSASRRLQSVILWIAQNDLQIP